MKSIDVKSLLIGFLLCATFFLSVGAVGGNNDNGKYQGFSVGENIYYVIDTRTGATWEAEFKDFRGRILDSWRDHGGTVHTKWKKVVKPNSF